MKINCSQTTSQARFTYLGQSSFTKTITIFIPSSIKIFLSVETSLNHCPCSSKIKHTINPFGLASWEADFESFRNSRTVYVAALYEKNLLGLGIPDLSCIKSPVRSSISDK